MADFYDELDYYRKVKDKFSTIRTANYNNTIILIDLYLPTTVIRFEPSEESVGYEVYRNSRTGKVTMLQLTDESERYAELTMLYSDYIALKQLKGYLVPGLRQSLVGHRLFISEKVGDMLEVVTRETVEEGLGTKYENASDLEATNFYPCLCVGVTHPTREVESEKMEVTLQLLYTYNPVFVEVALPL